VPNDSERATIALRRIVASYGPRTPANPKRVAALVADFAPGATTLVRTLIQVAAKDAVAMRPKQDE
jgi:hypothetical protein